MRRRKFATSGIYEEQAEMVNIWENRRNNVSPFNFKVYVWLVKAKIIITFYEVFNVYSYRKYNFNIKGGGKRKLYVSNVSKCYLNWYNTNFM